MQSFLGSASLAPSALEPFGWAFSPFIPSPSGSGGEDVAKEDSLLTKTISAQAHPLLSTFSFYLGKPKRG